VDNAINDVEDEIEDIQSEDDYNFKDIERLEKKLKEYNDSLEDLFDELPEIPEDLIDYDEEYCAFRENYSGSSPGDELDEPGPPDMTYDLEEPYIWAETVENYLETIDVPFSDYGVGEAYGDVEQSLGSKKWAIEPDSSVGEEGTGIEIKSPPMSVKEFIKICPKMFKWISKHGYTDNSCGFHIHMSLKNNTNLTKSLDLVKLTMFTDENYIFKFFPDRINNEYAKSMKKEMNKEGVTEDDWKDFIEVKKLRNKVASEHYTSINWEGLEDDNQHIEFRYMGGSQYHKKWDKIKTIIAQYGYNLDLACNDGSHRKEYALKIQRMLNKVEMVEIKRKYEWLVNLDQAEKEMPKEWKDIHRYITKEFKKYRKQYVDLVSIYGAKSGKEIGSYGINNWTEETMHELYKRLPKDVKMSFRDFMMEYI